MQELSQWPPLTKDKQMELVSAMNKGSPTAKDELILTNMRLVVYVAVNYFLKKTTVPFIDLISMGIPGLIKAIDKYDEEKGRLSTYAFYWIKQTIQRGIEDKYFHTVSRIPIHLAETIRKIKRYRKEADGNLTPDEFAQLMKISIRQIEKLLSLEQSYTLQIPISLTAEHDGGISLEEIQPQVDPTDDIIRHIDQTKIINELSIKISKKEWHILNLRYVEEQTLEEIGNQYKISRERVRQICEKTKRKLRWHLARKRRED